MVSVVVVTVVIVAVAAIVGGFRGVGWVAGLLEEGADCLFFF